MRKLFFIVYLLFSSIMFVDASSIYSIDMDIFVDELGNATVVEEWDAYVDQGTEGWHPYYNLGNSVISDVKVKMDDKSFTTVSDWDVDRSLSAKAYQAGLYYPSSNEVDICFGVSSYGRHKYSIEYKISNFVSTATDADIIYWNLFPYDFSEEPDNVTITIYSDFRYEDTLDVWGYGKYGIPCYVYDGKIEMTSDGKVNSDEYLTILVKFPKGTFETSSVLDNSFDYYYELAEDGAINYNDNSNSLGSKIILFLEVFLPIFINIFVWVLILISCAKASSKNKKVDFGVTGNIVSKDVPNFRDIPCNKDIYRAYWVASNYRLTKKKEDFLGAILLKWLRNGNVQIEKVVKDGLFKDKVFDNVIFVKRPDDGIELEVTLYDYMYEASVDGKLETNEFTKWCNKHYSEILKWFDEVLEFENKMLVNEGKAVVETVKKFKFFKQDVYKIDVTMMQEAEQMAGLKKFLKEFTMINQREPIEVQLWNEYLMYAQIFGMANEVASQFKKLYPEIITEMDNGGYTYNDFVFVHSITNQGIRSASIARSRAESYSSGGGGFSSGGGGGGSFGGGGGGGGFR